MSKITLNHKCFAGRVISNPIVLGKNTPFKAIALKALQEHGFTTKALEVMREAGVDPNRLKASSLVRAKFANGQLLKPTYLLNIPCTLSHLCVQGIKKGSTVMFMTVGVAPWVEPTEGKKGNRTMENGDKIHDPFQYAMDSLVIDVEAELEHKPKNAPIDLTFDQSPKARAITKGGTARRTLEVAKIFEEDLKCEPETETVVENPETATSWVTIPTESDVIDGPLPAAPEEVLVP